MQAWIFIGVDAQNRVAAALLIHLDSKVHQQNRRLTQSTNIQAISLFGALPSSGLSALLEGLDGESALDVGV